MSSSFGELNAQATSLNYKDSIVKRLQEYRPIGAEALAEEWLENSADSSENAEAWLYMARALCLRSQWDYQKVQQYYLKAIELVKHGKAPVLLAKARLGFLEAAYLHGDQDLKQPDFESIIKYGGKPLPFQLDALFLKMLYAFRFEDEAAAKKSLAPFKALQRRFMGYQPSYKDVIYAHLALEADEWEKATAHLMRAEENRLETSSILTVAIGELYLKMANRFAKNENFLMATEYAQRALLSSTIGFEAPADLAPNPEVHQLLELPLALKALLVKSRCIAKLDSTGQASRAAAALAAEVAGHLQNHNQSQQKLKEWWKYCDQAYQQALNSSYTYYEIQHDTQLPEEVFFFLERRKALWYWYLEQVHGRRAATAKQIREQELSRQSWYFQLATYRAQQNENMALFALHRQKLELVNEQREVVVAELTKTDLAYLATKYAANLPQIMAVQQQLSEGESLWHYAVTNDAVFVLIIGVEKRSFLKLGDLETFNKRRTTFSLQTDQSGLFGTKSTTQSLAEFLIPEVAKDAKRLLIIPDGELFALPMEALVWQLKEDGPVVNYQFSAKQWLKLLAQKPNPANYSLLAYSAQETSVVLDHLEGRFGALSYRGQWSDFAENLPYYGFLHLDHRDSTLLDSFLQVALAWQELRGWSAKKTSMLWTIQHELNQGVDAVILSIADLNAEARRQWVGLFYDYLQDGLAKDAAIQRAHLAYQAAHPIAESSAGWPAYRLYGDYRAITLSEPISYIWWYLIPIVALLGLGWWTVRGLRQRRKF